MKKYKVLKQFLAAGNLGGTYKLRGKVGDVLELKDDPKIERFIEHGYLKEVVEKKEAAKEVAPTRSTSSRSRSGR